MNSQSLEENKKIYQEHYSFEKFKALYEDDFDPRNGETCERYWEDLTARKISYTSSNLPAKFGDINIIEVLNDLGGVILPKKGKYEALRFKIRDHVYLVYYRFRRGAHYRFDEAFLKLLKYEM